jgi:hypothetical protein
MNDATYMLSNIFHQLGMTEYVRVKAFNAHAATAREMRNRADHLHGNFASIANLSTPMALLDTISYFYCSSAD